MKKQQDELWKDRRHVMWFPFSFDRYYIANNRLYCRHGLLRQDEHECLLYRILDISLTRTLGNRLFGTGTITLRTTDSSDPVLTLKNIKHSRAVKEMLSNLIEEERCRAGDLFHRKRNDGPQRRRTHRYRRFPLKSRHNPRPSAASKLYKGFASCAGSVNIEILNVLILVK